MIEFEMLLAELMLLAERHCWQAGAFIVIRGPGVRPLGAMLIQSW